MVEVEGHEAHRHRRVGALEIDHVGGKGLGDLRKRRLHGVHILKRRNFDVEALGAGQGQTKLAGTIAVMVATICLVFGSDRVAGAAGVS
jgi:hypothetical protein